MPPTTTSLPGSPPDYVEYKKQRPQRDADPGTFVRSLYKWAHPFMDNSAYANYTAIQDGSLPFVGMPPGDKQALHRFWNKIKNRNQPERTPTDKELWSFISDHESTRNPIIRDPIIRDPPTFLKEYAARAFQDLGPAPLPHVVYGAVVSFRDLLTEKGGKVFESISLPGTSLHEVYVNTVLKHLPPTYVTLLSTLLPTEPGTWPIDEVEAILSYFAYPEESTDQLVPLFQQLLASGTRDSPPAGAWPNLAEATAGIKPYPLQPARDQRELKQSGHLRTRNFGLSSPTTSRRGTPSSETRRRSSATTPTPNNPPSGRSRSRTGRQLARWSSGT